MGDGLVAVLAGSAGADVAAVEVAVGGQGGESSAAVVGTGAGRLPFVFVGNPSRRR